MAKLFFRKHKDVIDAPLSYDGYEGELTDKDRSFLALIIAEYVVYCGDVGEASVIRDKQLKAYRDEIIKMGHEVIER